jgi:glycosyltransferase involved in cell wall biosynthesis
MFRLAILTSHPIQYYAPWFRYLQANTNLDLRVFYLLDSTVTNQADQKFKGNVLWDIPLLEGYAYEFVPNVSQHPGTGHFWGLQNPTLIEQVKSFRPDAVLMMNYNYASLYRFLATWRHTPLLFRGDSHRIVPETGLKAALKRQWIAQIYQRFDACLYVGQANRKYFQYHGVGDERLFFSPHAIDNERFIAQGNSAEQKAILWKQALGIPNDHRVILFAGKLIPKKRPLDLLQAFLAANLFKVSLLFVGSGELEDELRQQAQASGHNHIYFAPFQNQSQMPRTYAAGDVMVLPSYGSGETWGLAVNEMMCLARPVIVSSHVGCSEDLIKPELNGLFFPAGNIDALTDCLKSAFGRHRHHLSDWGIFGQKLIHRYSYPCTTQGLLDALSAQLKASDRQHHELQNYPRFSRNHTFTNRKLDAIANSIPRN